MNSTAVPTYATPVPPTTAVMASSMASVTQTGHDGDYRLSHDQWQTVPSNPYPHYEAVSHHDSGVYMKAAAPYHVGSVGA
jgi:hypothetical protein